MIQSFELAVFNPNQTALALPDFTFLAINQTEKTMKYIIDFLKRPIILYGFDLDTLMPEQKQRIHESRIQQLTEYLLYGKKPDRATNWETLCYFMSASLAGPLTSEYTKIYMNVFATEFPGANDVYDQRDLHLNDWEQHLLRELQEHIFKASLKHAVKEKRKRK